jgi:hypothetical protein
VIDEASPLSGHDAEAPAASDGRVFLTIEARDQALATVVHDIKDYLIEQVRFGMHFAGAIMLDADRRATADPSRISLLEPDSGITAGS